MKFHEYNSDDNQEYVPPTKAEVVATITVTVLCIAAVVLFAWFFFIGSFRY